MNPPNQSTRSDNVAVPNLVHTGLERSFFDDTYHHLMQLPWLRFIGLLAVIYAVVNLIFMGLFLAGGDCFGAPHPGDPLEAFSFSVQTISGIGYGAMSPTTHYAHVISIIEAFVGLLLLAMMTGLMFAKFARPTARVAFADRAVIRTHNGVPTLFFRMANRRTSKVIDATLHAMVLIDTVSDEGQGIRRMVSLPLLRSHNPLFVLAWLAIHPIDENSPLRPLIDEEGELTENFAGLFVTLVGIDEAFNQSVYAQHRYSRATILRGFEYVDIMDSTDNEVRIDHSKLHDVRPLVDD